MASLEALRERVRAARDEVYRVEQADDYAHTSGAYSRAMQALARATQQLREMEGESDASIDADANSTTA